MLYVIKEVGIYYNEYSYIERKYRKKFKRIPNEDLESMSSKEDETCELNRMKHNAFKMCEEVSQRVDGGMARGGYIKAWVTPDENSLFL